MVKKQDKRTKQQLLAELEALQSGQALKETEDWFSRVFHRGPVAISIVDTEEGRHIDINESFLRLMEYTRQEVIGNTSVELGFYVNPADREKMTRLFKDSGRVADFGCSMRTKTGRLLDVLVFADMVLHSGKKRVVSMIVDITERKRAEEALRQSEERFRALVENLPVSITITSQDGQTYMANKTFLETRGYGSLEELQREPISARYNNPEDRERWLAMLKEKGRVDNFEVRIKRKDGSVYWSLATSIPWITDSGERRLLSVSRDITARKRVEEALLRSEETLRIFVEHSPAAIAMFDRDMKYIVASRRYLSDYGLEDQNLVGRSHYDVFPELTERHKEIHRRCLAGAVENAQEDEFPRLSGKVDWIHWEMRPWYEADGVIGGVILFSEVITERKRAEEALRQSEERFRTLVESTPVGIAITSFDGKLVMANEAVQRMRGYSSKEELMQATIAERYYDPADRERWLGLMKTEGVCRDFEIRLKRKDGSLFWASFNSIVVKAASGEPQIFNVIQDIAARKMAEDALRESEERFRNLVNDAPVGVTISSPSGRIILMNKALLKMHGYDTQAEFNSVPVSERYYNPADRERWLKLLREQARAEGVEVHLKRKDGTDFWATFDTIPQVSKEGEQQFITIVRDITESKKADDAIRQSEDSFRQLSEASFEGIIIHDQGKIVLANIAFARLNGYELSEVIGMNVTDFIPPEERRQVMEKIRAGYREPYETVGMRKDGTLYIGEARGMEIEYHGRRLRAAAVRDITERKKAEDRLRESEEKYRDLVNRVNDGIFATDERGIFTFANKALAEIHGVSNPDELIGKSFLDFIVPEQREEVVARFIQSLNTGNAPRNLEVSIMMASGGIAHIQINAVPVLENGVIVGTTGVVRDITEQRQILGQLIAAGRLASIGQLVAGIAHEMNNPLTSVIGFSELLKTRKNLPEDIREDIETVNREAKRTAGIIMGLLTFARQQKTEKELININNIIPAVVQLRAYEQKVSNIEVETRFADDLPEISGNTGQMQQVFINLIVNAEQSMADAHRRGKLTIVTEHAGDIVRISFADDGGGIKLEDMPKLFTPFFTTKPVGKGTGLGLSICHGIIAEHGGRIYAASEPGKGATFVIELPIGNKS